MSDLLHRLFDAASKYEASDIHLTRDVPPYLRVSGKVVGIKGDPLSDSDIAQAIEPTLKSNLKRQYEEKGYVDYAHEEVIGTDANKKRVRYRVHLYSSRGSMAVALRRLILHIPSFEELHLPLVYEQVVSLRPKGIIIVGGETGSGKSTTLARMIDHINERHDKRIVTIEDPIEYVIENKRCKINQRELGADFRNYQEALRAVVREDPDVIMIGELRDGETVRATIAAAETGHLVLTSLHTASVTETFNRILYFFPPNEEDSVRQNLCSTLIAIMNQMLLPTIKEAAEKTDAIRVPATEVLLNTPVIREHIRDKEKESDLGNIIAEGEDGMHDFNMSLMRLCDANFIGMDTAIRTSLKPESFKMLAKGIK